MSASNEVAISVERRASGFTGVAKRNGELLCTCGHPGHLFADEARDCVVAMARGIGLVVS